MTYRPVRLIYNYASASLPPQGMVLPWQPSVNDGMWKMNVDPADAERDNLLFWAQTNWGEIPYKFKFGLDARRHLFDPSPTLKQRIEDNARAQLRKYFGYLKILQVKVYTQDEDSNLSPNQIRFYLLAETNKGKQIEVKETIGI